jgi:hypothetical protein
MLRWNRNGFHKKRSGARYAELVFLRPVGLVGHVMHSCVSRARNIDALFFMLGWDRYVLYKKHVETHFIILVFFHPVGYAGHVVQSCASGM